MRDVKHRYICKYIDSFTTNANKLYLIMEYCDRGDLAQYLSRIKSMAQGPLVSANHLNKQQHKQPMSWTEIGEARVWRIFLQICLALEVIHEKGIVHADLKPSNLLMLGSDHIIKLTDFGIAQKLTEGYNFSHDFAGTLPYSSPEVIKGEPYNAKTDVWALGCILYELVAGKRAFDFANEELIKQQIHSYQIPKLPTAFSSYETINALSDVYELCMQRNQEKRPSVSDILSIDAV